MPMPRVSLFLESNGVGFLYTLHSIITRYLETKLSTHSFNCIHIQWCIELVHHHLIFLSHLVATNCRTRRISLWIQSYLLLHVYSKNSPGQVCDPGKLHKKLFAKYHSPYFFKFKIDFR